MSRAGKEKGSSHSVERIILILLLIVSIVLTTVWARESSTGPLHRVRSVLTTINTPIIHAGNAVFSPISRFGEWTSSLTANSAKNEKLEKENTELRATVMHLEESRQEAERLRELLEIKNALEMESVGARVIGKSSDNWSEAVLIDKGRKDGIEEGVAVISEDGLVGKVVEVARSSAVVQLIEDPSIGVAAKIQSSRTDGVIVGAGDGSLRLNFVSRDVEVQPGDVVITSGLGGVFPKGINIGEVFTVDSQGSGVYQSILVRPAARSSSLEEVLVITGFDGDAMSADEGGE